MENKRDTSKTFETCIRKLASYRREDVEKGLKRNAIYNLDDLKIFYKTIFNELKNKGGAKNDKV